MKCSILQRNPPYLTLHNIQLPLIRRSLRKFERRIADQDVTISKVEASLNDRQRNIRDCQSTRAYGIEDTAR